MSWSNEQIWHLVKLLAWSQTPACSYDQMSSIDRALLPPDQVASDDEEDKALADGDSNDEGTTMMRTMMGLIKFKIDLWFFDIVIVNK